MNLINLVIFFVVVCVSLGSETLKEPSLKLNHKTFKTALAENKIVFVKFHTTWCHMCKGMLKIWRNLGVHYANDPRVLIAEMDCELGSEEDDICDDVDVDVYPTYVLFYDGKVEKTYEAEKTKRQLIGYVERSIQKHKVVKDEN